MESSKFAHTMPVITALNVTTTKSMLYLLGSYITGIFGNIKLRNTASCSCFTLKRSRFSILTRQTQLCTMSSRNCVKSWYSNISFLFTTGFGPHPPPPGIFRDGTGRFRESIDVNLHCARGSAFDSQLWPQNRCFNFCPFRVALWAHCRPPVTVASYPRKIRIFTLSFCQDPEGGGERIPPTINHIGMCCSRGYGFCHCLVAKVNGFRWNNGSNRKWVKIISYPKWRCVGNFLKSETRRDCVSVSDPSNLFF